MIMSSKKSKKQKKKKSHKEKKKDKEIKEENHKKSKDSPKIEIKSESSKRKRSKSRSRSTEKKEKTDEKKRKSSRETHHHHHHHHYHHKNERTKSRSRSRSKRNEEKEDRKHYRRNKSPSPIDLKNDLNKIDKKKLLEIAKANICKSSLKLKYTNINIENVNASSLIKSGSTKSINELVEYCKKLTNENEDNENDKIYHPFEKKDVEEYFATKNHLFSANKEVFETAKEIQSAFPVSSGCEHRMKLNEGENPSSNEKIQNNDDMDIQISDLIIQKTRLTEILNQNQANFEARKSLEEINLKIQAWVNSKQTKQIGVFKNDARFLRPEELEGQYIAWTRKDLLSNAAPITDGIGKRLLEKMGWKQGEGLGKRKEGSLNPLSLGIKTDRKGLVSIEETVKTKIFDFTSFPENKHPINILLEYCRIRKWKTPDFELVSETGPPHMRVFKMKVTVNNIVYEPTLGSNNKKAAKTDAAVVCLQELGLLSK